MLSWGNLQWVHLKLNCSWRCTDLHNRFHAGTYGIPDQRTLEAMRLGASLEGMITDPVYEGKSLAGLIHMVQEREIPPDANVLFAHLGGQPALNAYASLFT